MTDVQEFIDKWNQSIGQIGFKLTSDFLKAPRSEAVVEALLSLLTYMNYDTEAITQMDENAEFIIMERSPLNNVVNVISFIYENTSSSKILFSLLDVLEPSPKRTLRILRELHNYALYVKVISEITQSKLDEKNSAKSGRNDQISQMIDRENALALELDNYQTLTKKSIEKYPQTSDEEEQCSKDIDEVKLDVEESRAKLSHYKQELDLNVQESLKIQENIEVLKKQVVNDPDGLKRRLVEVENESQMYKGQKLKFQEVRRNKTNECVNLNKALVALIELCNALKKNIDLYENHFKTSQEFVNEDGNETDMIIKEFHAVQNQKISMEKQQQERGKVFNEGLQEKKDELSRLQREEQNFEQRAIEVQKDVNKAEEFFRHAEAAIEKNTSLQHIIQREMKEYEHFLQAQIVKIELHSQQRCAQYDSNDLHDFI